MDRCCLRGVAILAGLALVMRSTPQRSARSLRSVPTSVRHEKIAEAGPRGQYRVTLNDGRIVVTKADESDSAAEPGAESEAEAEREAEAAREAAAAGGPEAERDREGSRGKPEGESEILSGPSAQQVDQRAYPRGYVDSARAEAARRSYTDLPQRVGRSQITATRSDRAAGAGRRSLTAGWQDLGPRNPRVPGSVTYTGRETTNSGRVTALALAPDCAPGDCRLWVAAAGGGIWRTDDALAAVPDWQAQDNGLPTTSFGSLLVDPTDPTGNTVYAGSGEPNGSSDSEAGLGLFRSTDGGAHWALVPGSAAVARDRSVASIAIDPTDSDTIWIGTALARHGSSAVNGGRRTPPGASTLGIYRSTDGGDFFSLQFSRPGSSQNPADGQDYFDGGVTKLVWDPNDHRQLYAAITGYGIFRLHNPNDGVCGCDDNQWHQVYQALFGNGTFLTDGSAELEPDPYGARDDFDLADLGGATRLYVGDSSDAYGVAVLVMGDGVDAVANSDLLVAEKSVADPGGIGAPWQMRSNADITDSLAGFSSYNFCQNGQCGYDMFVVADPTDPDTVWLGGAMAYDELEAFGSQYPRSNGRAVVRSTDAGVTFTDMTNDSQDPPLGMHPDQHALVINPAAPGQVFVGSDGGVVRTSGSFVDGNPGDAVCGARTFSGPTAAQDLEFCRLVLSVVPERIDSLNVGLDTLQFQSASLDRTRPYTDVIAGTQDNGTWAWDGADDWFESVGGDGGNSGISDAGGSRMHTYYGPSMDVNFRGNDPQWWANVSGPMDVAESEGKESFSFYVPVLADPRVDGTYFMAGEYVWRTQDSGGARDSLESKCLEGAIGYPAPECGDFERIGRRLSPDGPMGADFIVALGRTPADRGTLWVGLRQGELFLSHNAHEAAAQVSFRGLKAPTLPHRFVSGIAVDPSDANHAWISYSGYGAYTPDTPGHVFEARYHPGSRSATFVDRSYDLGDQPVTGISLDGLTGDVYAATDFGVARLPAGGTAWGKAAEGLPSVAVYGLTGQSGERVLYAATHGRGIHRLALDPVAEITGPTSTTVGTPVTLTAGRSAGYRSTALRWVLPDGTTSTADRVTFAPRGTGPKVVRLTVTDSLGHRATTTRTITVQGRAGLTPRFGSVTRRNGGFRVAITNFDPHYRWAATSTHGQVSVSRAGRVTVTGLSPKQKATVTVTATQPGRKSGSASVTGRSTGNCVLSVTARSGRSRVRVPGRTTLVQKAAAGRGCRLAPARVTSQPRAPITVNRNQSTGKVRVALRGDTSRVTVRYRAEPLDQGRQTTWMRSWRTR